MGARLVALLVAFALLCLSFAPAGVSGGRAGPMHPGSIQIVRTARAGASGGGDPAGAPRTLLDADEEEGEEGEADEEHDGHEEPEEEDAILPDSEGGAAEEDHDEADASEAGAGGDHDEADEVEHPLDTHEDGDDAEADADAEEGKVVEREEDAAEEEHEEEEAHEEEHEEEEHEEEHEEEEEHAKPKSAADMLQDEEEAEAEDGSHAAAGHEDEHSEEQQDEEASAKEDAKGPAAGHEDEHQDEEAEAEEAPADGAADEHEGHEEEEEEEEEEHSEEPAAVDEDAHPHRMHARPMEQSAVHLQDEAQTALAAVESDEAVLEGGDFPPARSRDSDPDDDEDAGNGGGRMHTGGDEHSHEYDAEYTLRSPRDEARGARSSGRATSARHAVREMARREPHDNLHTVKRQRDAAWQAYHSKEFILSERDECHQGHKKDIPRWCKGHKHDDPARSSWDDVHENRMKKWIQLTNQAKNRDWYSSNKKAVDKAAHHTVQGKAIRDKFGLAEI